MAKVNSWLAKQQAIAEIRATAKAEMHRRFALQQSQDMAVIALHEAFGFGAERVKKFVDTYNAVFEHYAEMAIEDAKDDEDIDYTRGKFDEILKTICGEYFIPWDERYEWVYQIEARKQHR